MIRVRDIYSLTDFQRRAKEHIRRLKTTGDPQVLTVNGRAEVVVQDAMAYEALLEKVERAETIAGIRRGLEALERSEGRPAAEAFQAIRSKHQIDAG